MVPPTRTTSAVASKHLLEEPRIVMIESVVMIQVTAPLLAWSAECGSAVCGPGRGLFPASDSDGVPRTLARY
jgi:hypothetical protein